MKKRSLAIFSISFLFCSLYFLSCRKDNIEGICSEKDWIAVDQGALWTDDIRNAYYTEDQGVRNIPYSWLTSLKDASGSRFLYDKLQRYGFLPMPGRQMPVGFALGRDTANILSAGLTCAGCHTRQINVGDESYRIDGGPALINFEKYTKDLQAALTYTVNNSIELEQFLDRVIIASMTNGDPAINDRNALRNKVIRFQQNLSLFNQLSLPADNMWGLGRLDALNQILNRVSGIDISPYSDSMIVSNISPANNPVRFPFIWNMQYQDYTQWAGTGVNGNSTQALLRNGGECLGVGAQFRPVPNASMPDGFDFLAVNSVNFDGLNALEQYINKMGPPRWPWFVNSSLVAQGEGLYIDNCASCHGITPGEPRPPTASTWATPLVDVGTDNWYYETLSRMGSPGVLSSILPADVALITISGLCNQKMLKQYDPSISFIPTTHTTIVVGKYESRVLQGIWAAAPYLHNGSVPTLEDLLKPASERPSSFFVGVNFDTTKVGLSEDQPVSNGYQFSTFGLGNSNAGHEYGTQLNPQERAALIEYMKTL